MKDRGARTGRSLLGRAMQRVLERRARRGVPYGTGRRPPAWARSTRSPVRDPYLESMTADPDRHAVIMASLERQVDELGPHTR